jgi:hypothetical protein
VTAERIAIAGRYLGEAAAFAAARSSPIGVLLRLEPEDPRVWDLSTILPAEKV